MITKNYIYLGLKTLLLLTTIRQEMYKGNSCTIGSSSSNNAYEYPFICLDSNNMYREETNGHFH
jgi:hypothetical protein